jgi:hypothetical protein
MKKAGRIDDAGEVDCSMPDDRTNERTNAFDDVRTSCMNGLCMHFGIGLDVTHNGFR